MLAGVTVIDTVGGGGLVTFTLNVDVAVPPGPVALAVYIVVLEGEPVTDPFTGFLPILLSRVTEVALVVVQFNVVLPPRVTVSGVAVKTMVGGNTTFTVTLEGTAGPPGPFAVAV